MEEKSPQEVVDIPIPHVPGMASKVTGAVKTTTWRHHRSVHTFASTPRIIKFHPKFLMKNNHITKDQVHNFRAALIKFRLMPLLKNDHVTKGQVQHFRAAQDPFGRHAMTKGVLCCSEMHWAWLQNVALGPLSCNQSSIIASDETWWSVCAGKRTLVSPRRTPASIKLFSRLVKTLICFLWLYVSPSDRLPVPMIDVSGKFPQQE